METSVTSAYLTEATGAQNKDILLMIARVNFEHLSIYWLYVILNSNFPYDHNRLNTHANIHTHKHAKVHSYIRTYKHTHTNLHTNFAHYGQFKRIMCIKLLDLPIASHRNTITLMPVNTATRNPLPLTDIFYRLPTLYL